jgi:predicted nicotinamide N-methyase
MVRAVPGVTGLTTNGTRPWRPELVPLPTRAADPEPELGGLRLALASVRARRSEINRALSATEDMLAAVSAPERAPDGGLADGIRATAMRSVPRWHFAMLNDHERNGAFSLALQRRVRPGSHVLDIGSGTGLLAMMAVRAGAGRVTTCEADPLLAEIATRVVAQNGLSDVITVLPRMSTDLRAGVDLPPADLIVSEIVDCALIGEGILPTIRHARQHLLAPGGTLLPERGRLLGALVESNVVAGLNRVSSAGGFDVRLLNALATPGHFPVRLRTWPHRLLSEPVELVRFDFARDPLTDGERAVAVPVTTDGQAHALVSWFELELAGGIALCNAPTNYGSHWMQAFSPFEEPVKLLAGGTYEVRLRWRDQQLSVRPGNVLDKAEVA